jgi:hypothetical protein
MFLYLAQGVSHFIHFAAQLIDVAVSFVLAVLAIFVAVAGLLAILTRFAGVAFAFAFIHPSGVSGQFLGPIAHSGGLQMFDGCADVFHSGFVAAFAFAAFAFAVFAFAVFTFAVFTFAVFTFPLAAFAVLVALGHFGFHVAKQFFGFFVFAFFAKLIDCAFGLLDELAHFLVLFPFAAFAVLVAFGHFGFHVAKQFFGFFVFAFFAKLIDCAFGLFNELPYFVIFVIFFPLSFLIIAFTVFTLVSGSLTVAFARFAALTFTGFVAIAPFVVVVGPCGPSETYACNQQSGHYGNPFLHRNAFV